MVGVSAENRELAHVAGGDEVDVDIELDTQPRELTLPSDFSAALDRQPDAKRLFDTLSYSRQQALVLPIIQAKTPETRQRRVDKGLLALQESRAQWEIASPAVDLRAHFGGRGQAVQEPEHNLCSTSAERLRL